MVKIARCNGVFQYTTYSKRKVTGIDSVNEGRMKDGTEKDHKLDCKGM